MVIGRVKAKRVLVLVLAVLAAGTVQATTLRFDFSATCTSDCQPLDSFGFELAEGDLITAVATVNGAFFEADGITSSSTTAEFLLDFVFNPGGQRTLTNETAAGFRLDVRWGSNPLEVDRAELRASEVIGSDLPAQGGLTVLLPSAGTWNITPRGRCSDLHCSSAQLKSPVIGLGGSLTTSSVTPVPAPPAVWLLLSGLFVVGLMQRFGR